jgi:hypothetical protein
VMSNPMLRIRRLMRGAVRQRTNQMMYSARRVVSGSNMLSLSVRGFAR